jgi:transcriptional regulator of arginine metabolism
VSEARARRHKLIAEFLRTHQLASQEELTGLLAEHGLVVNQATVSRDLDQMGAVKVRRSGNLSYAMPDQLSDRDWAVDRLRRLVTEWVQSADTAGNLVILKTPPGSAHLVAHAIDQARQPDIVGTIAGDDTIFVAVGEANLAARIATWFRDPPAE